MLIWRNHCLKTSYRSSANTIRKRKLSFLRSVYLETLYICHLGKLYMSRIGREYIFIIYLFLLKDNSGYKLEKCCCIFGLFLLSLCLKNGASFFVLLYSWNINCTYCMYVWERCKVCLKGEGNKIIGKDVQDVINLLLPNCIIPDEKKLVLCQTH